MKKLFLLAAFLGTFTLTDLVGQDYNNAIGLRISPYYGVTFKHFFNETRALEAILSTRKGGVGLTGLYEIHTPAFKVERLKAFGGVGGHFNVFRDEYSDDWDWDDEKDNGSKVGNDHRMTIGLDMIIGLEYTLTDLPFNFGLDWKPALNVIGGYGFSLDQFALSFRFTF